jgi:hypothetical protein
MVDRSPGNGHDRDHIDLRGGFLLGVVGADRFGEHQETGLSGHVVGVKGVHRQGFSGGDGQPGHVGGHVMQHRLSQATPFSLQQDHRVLVEVARVRGEGAQTETQRVNRCLVLQRATGLLYQRLPQLR